MASTKNLRTITAASTSLASAGTVNGTEVDLSTKYGGVLTAKIINGTATISAAANCYIYTGGSSGTKKLFAKLAGDLTASSTNEYTVDIPPGVMYLNVTFTDLTTSGSAATVEAYLQELTTI